MEMMHSPNCEHEVCQEDWPAAHSMCTDWFGVDEQGHIALFFSDDSGAVPSGSLRSPEDYSCPDNLERWSAFHTWLESSQPPGAAVIEGDGLIEYYRDHVKHHAIRSYEKMPDCDTLKAHPKFAGRYLMILDDQCPNIDKLGIEPCKFLPSTSKIVVDIEGETFGRLRDWHEKGVCLGCKYVYQEELAYAERGIFMYRHSQYATMAPYARLLLRSAPLSIYDLPEELVDSLFKTLFVDVCFGNTFHIQPAEHCDVLYWGHDYFLASDMKTIRPVKGEEESYAEYFDDIVRLYGDWAHYQIMPPQSQNSSETDKESDAQE